MTTATTVKKFTAVEIEFTFENDVTKAAFDNIVRKVGTVTKNAQYESTTVFFANFHTVRAIVTFDVSYDSMKIYDSLRAPLQRLIDSHKQAATYGWCYSAIAN